MLTLANSVAAWWTSAAVTAIPRQQRAMLNAMKLKIATKRRTKTGKR
jgi:hypothetical protein